MSSRKPLTFSKGRVGEKHAPPPPPPAPEPAPVRQAWPVPPSRQGKRSVTVYVNEDAFDQLQRLSLDTKRPIIDLMREGMDALFLAHGLPAKAAEG